MIYMPQRSKNGIAIIGTSAACGVDLVRSFFGGLHARSHRATDVGTVVQLQVEWLRFFPERLFR